MQAKFISTQKIGSQLLTKSVISKKTIPLQGLPFLFWHPRATFSTSHIIKQTTLAAQLYESFFNHTTTPSPDIIKYCNIIGQIVDEIARKDPKQIAIKYYPEDSTQLVEITYSTLVERSHQLATFLKGRNLKKGDAVGVMTEQNPIFCYAVAALLRIGLVVIPLPPSLTRKDLSYRINELDIKALITTQKHEDKVDAIREQCLQLHTTITTGSRESKKNWYSTQDIFNTLVTIFFNEYTTQKDRSHGFLTSGTTGPSKKAIHQQEDPFAFFPAAFHWLRASKDDIICNLSDPGWGFFLWVFFMTILAEASLFQLPERIRTDTAKTLEFLNSGKITILAASVSQLLNLINCEFFEACSFKGIKHVIVIGEVGSQKIFDAFASKGILVLQAYGQAETAVLSVRDNPNDNANSIGKPIDPYTNIVLLDENDNIIPPQQKATGQIALRFPYNKPPPGLFSGYFKAEEKTKNAFVFKEDGYKYYKTGDLAEQTEDGKISILGRRGEALKVDNYNFSAYEVEERGLSHPAVAKIAVIQSADNEIKAFILLKSNYEPSLELITDIKAHYLKETAPYRCPAKIEFVSQDKWERIQTYSGKTRRALLQEWEKRKKLCKDNPEELKIWEEKNFLAKKEPSISQPTEDKNLHGMKMM